LEALAVGTPVIGSALGGVAELVQDGRTGALVPPADPRALATLLTTLGEQPTLVDAWRHVLPAPRTMDDVCRDTLALYARPVPQGSRHP
jgi:glycosyltransferase involved in cell wall biosynthesis